MFYIYNVCVSVYIYIQFLKYKFPIYNRNFPIMKNLEKN